MADPKNLDVMVLQAHQFGFDYRQAVLDINRRWSYEKIARFCGYESKGSIARVAAGGVPSHPIGEALYILYVEMFNRKPPLKVQRIEQLSTA